MDQFIKQIYFSFHKHDIFKDWGRNCVIMSIRDLHTHRLSGRIKPQPCCSEAAVFAFPSIPHFHFIAVSVCSDTLFQRRCWTVKLKHIFFFYNGIFSYNRYTQWGRGDCKEIMPSTLRLRRLDSAGQRSNLWIEETFACTTLSYVNQPIIVPISAASKLLIDFYATIPKLCIHSSHFKLVQMSTTHEEPFYCLFVLSSVDSTLLSRVRLLNASARNGFSHICGIRLADLHNQLFTAVFSRVPRRTFDTSLYHLLGR